MSGQGTQKITLTSKATEKSKKKKKKQYMNTKKSIQQCIEENYRGT